jgi:chromosome partitioning protein
VIPVATTYLALDGCAELVATVKRVAQEYGHDKLHVTQLVPTLYRKTQLADEVLGKLREYFPKQVTEPVALNVSIDEAQSHGKTIWEHAPWSRGATMLQHVAERIERAR